MWYPFFWSNSVTRFQQIFVVCFDSPVVVASSPALEVKLVTKLPTLKIQGSEKWISHFNNTMESLEHFSDDRRHQDLSSIRIWRQSKERILLTVAAPEIWNTLEIQKNENLLRSPKFYGENEFPVEMCISQLITEILSFSCFHKNFMTNLSFKIAIQPSRVQHFWRYTWIRLTP